MFLNSFLGWNDFVVCIVLFFIAQCSSLRIILFSLLKVCLRNEWINWIPHRTWEIRMEGGKKAKMCFLTVHKTSWLGRVESWMKGVLKQWRGKRCFGGCVWCSACRLYCAWARSSLQLPPLWLWGLKGGAPRFLFVITESSHLVKWQLASMGFVFKEFKSLLPGISSSWVPFEKWQD